MLLVKNQVNAKFFGEKSKNWDKMIKSKTPRQHTKNWDCPGKTWTVGIFAWNDP